MTADDGTRLHFHDWGGAGGDGAWPGRRCSFPGCSSRPGRGRRSPGGSRGAPRTVVADLRGHGLSDAPMTGYDLETLAAERSPSRRARGRSTAGTVVLAGSRVRRRRSRPGRGGPAGGAMRRPRARGRRLRAPRGDDRRSTSTSSCAASRSRRRCSGRWTPGSTTAGRSTRDLGRGPGAERPRRASSRRRPATWCARVRPHVVEAVVRAMFDDDPATAVADGRGAGRRSSSRWRAGGGGRAAARSCGGRRRRRAAGRAPLRVAGFPGAGHNLMRYRPGRGDRRDPRRHHAAPTGR